MKFKTKLILFSGFSLLFGVALTATIALLSINRLSDVAGQEVEKGLRAANEEYFENFMGANLRRTDLLLQGAVTDAQTLTGLAQALEDHRADFGPLYEQAARLPGLGDDLRRDPQGGWVQNPPGGPSVVTVLPNMLNPDGSLKPEVAAAIRQTTLLNLVFPVVKKYGLDKAQIAYLAAPDISYARITPWNPNAEGLAGADPQGYRTKNYWDYLPPGILASWERWAAQPTLKNSLPNEVAFATPRLDTATNSLITTLFQPVWDANRQKVRGLVSIDFSLAQTASLVKDLKLATTGFAFLAQANGNVLAVNDAGEKVMGLKARIGTIGGFQGLNRYLQTSSVPGLAKLALPKDNNLRLNELDIGGKKYMVILGRLAPINFLADPSRGIAPEAWTLGFVVPTEELLAAVRNTQAAISDSRRDLIWLSLGSAGLALLLVGLLIYLMSGPMTRALRALTRGAAQIQAGNLDVQVELKSKDEFGKLGQAFNAMALEVKRHTTGLEDLVRERTGQLEVANDEITALNKQLQAENWRMKAELDITRRLQQMILPKDQELLDIVGLDISGFMESADEVGGDYYDVIRRADGSVKIGIGDVTGHGLESGVLMIMVQAAVRTMLTTQENELDLCLSAVNRSIYENAQRMQTDKNLSLSLLDYHNGRLRLSGQHEQMIVVRRDERIEMIDTVDLGFPVGLEHDISAFVSQLEVTLAGGDIVILYTDGIPEAANLAGEQYGLERLCEVVRRNRHLAASALKTAIISDLRRFIGTQKVFDDITLVVLKQKEPEVTAESVAVEGELILV